MRARVSVLTQSCRECVGRAVHAPNIRRRGALRASTVAPFQGGAASCMVEAFGVPVGALAHCTQVAQNDRACSRASASARRSARLRQLVRQMLRHPASLQPHQVAGMWTSFAVS